jgi:hypothetical protein
VSVCTKPNTFKIIKNPSQPTSRAVQSRSNSLNAAKLQERFFGNGAKLPPNDNQFSSSTISSHQPKELKIQMKNKIIYKT